MVFVFAVFCYIQRCTRKMRPPLQRTLTIDSDLAITITVTSSEESLGLLVSECSGTSREVLQEQPERRKNSRS